MTQRRVKRAKRCLRSWQYARERKREIRAQNQRRVKLATAFALWVDRLADLRQQEETERLNELRAMAHWLSSILRRWHAHARLVTITHSRSIAFLRDRWTVTNLGDHFYAWRSTALAGHFWRRRAAFSALSRLEYVVQRGRVLSSAERWWVQRQGSECLHRILRTVDERRHLHRQQVCARSLCLEPIGASCRCAVVSN